MHYRPSMVYTRTYSSISDLVTIGAQHRSHHLWRQQSHSTTLQATQSLYDCRLQYGQSRISSRFEPLPPGWITAAGLRTSTCTRAPASLASNCAWASLMPPSRAARFFASCFRALSRDCFAVTEDTTHTEPPWRAAPRVDRRVDRRGVTAGLTSWAASDGAWKKKKKKKRIIKKMWFKLL